MEIIYSIRKLKKVIPPPFQRQYGMRLSLAGLGNQGQMRSKGPSGLRDEQPKRSTLCKLYPVRNNAPLFPPNQRPSGATAAAGLDFRIIPAGFNAPLEFLTGFTAGIGDYGFSTSKEKGTINLR